MRREALADRIVGYSDALVAFALVNGLAFIVALGEPDIRCSIAGIAIIVALLNAIFSIALTFLLVWLGRYEQRLRGDDEADELVLHFWNRLSALRFVLIWLFTAIVLFGIWAATQDPSCVASLAASGKQ